MNLIDAINSNLPFKRPLDKHWWVVGCGGWIRSEDWVVSSLILPIIVENLTATDYIIQEKYTELNWERVKELYMLGMYHGSNTFTDIAKESINISILKLKHKLGFPGDNV